MFAAVLIANRGEIACRIIRTCRRLGVRTVAVHSDADRDALHVALADEARRIGPAPARESYLSIAAVIAAARAARVEAIHPGYGFLAENADFAQACADAGVVFIGPSAEAIRTLGAKDAAKELMAGAGVPVVPGRAVTNDGEALARAVEALGFPVLIKPVAGGGGKGMRIVARPEDLAEAAASRREARAAFGDDRLMVERFLERPRHVEVQVLADRHGGAVHLFERDCSLQRRHQKIIEEAPAPGVDEATRERLGQAALAAVRAAGYEGAGTVEFLLATDGAWYFLEMNTRLQVEHPVTEMITGLDLVEWQIRIAAGERLAFGQDRVRRQGHAIEARLYAEDPARGFLPSPGVIRTLRLPRSGPELRIDAGVRQGDAVPPDYDPLIAKLIVHGRDRRQAVERLRRALGRAHIEGLVTNRDFLVTLASHPAFTAGTVDTGLVERELAPAPPRPPSPEVVVAAALAAVTRRADEAGARARRSADPHSPWYRADGWRLNAPPHQRVMLDVGGEVVAVDVEGPPGACVVQAGGTRLRGRIVAAADREVEVEMVPADGGPGELRRVRVGCQGPELVVDSGGHSHRLRLVDPLAAGRAAEAPAGELGAPLPATVTRVLVAAGQRVRRGEALVILEAMKMEHKLTAPADGTVEEVRVAEGARVDQGAELVSFRPDGEG